MLGTAAALVKSTLVPGSMGLLLVGVLAGVACLYVPALARWGRRWLLAISVFYIVLAMPVVSWWLERGTGPTYPPITSAADARGATAIVVLGNGIVSYEAEGARLESLTRRTAYNVMEGVRLYRLLQPEVVIASGGLATLRRRSEAEAVRDALVSLGVPRQAIVLESRSSNTAEQAQNVGPLLQGHGPFLLVTSPIHMPRAVALFRSRGLDPVPAPSRIDYTGEVQQSPLRFVPSAAALRASELSMYEYLGMAYGQSRGWLDPARDTPQ